MPSGHGTIYFQIPQLVQIAHELIDTAELVSAWIVNPICAQQKNVIHHSRSPSTENLNMRTKYIFHLIGRSNPYIDRFFLAYNFTNAYKYFPNFSSCSSHHTQSLVYKHPHTNLSFNLHNIYTRNRILHKRSNSTCQLPTYNYELQQHHEFQRYR